jgi:ABC-type cobalamin/Fe3+-siderophores transport system ATPase subunit
LSDLDQLGSRITRLRREIDRSLTEARLIATNGKKLQEEIALSQADADLYARVSITLASIGETRQTTAQQTIEELVTRGLQTIFGPELSFHVIQSQRGKIPEVKFVVRSLANGKPIETSVMDSRGGGMASVVGFLLRLVVLLLNRDTKDPILVLDESFSHVSIEYEAALVDFIRELLAKTRVQIVLVTHRMESLNEVADKRYKFKLVKGVTQVTEF